MSLLQMLLPPPPHPPVEPTTADVTLLDQVTRLVVSEKTQTSTKSNIPVKSNPRMSTHLEVAELEGFAFVAVEAISDKADSRHQDNEQHHAHTHPRLVSHLHLQGANRGEAASRVSCSALQTQTLGRLCDITHLMMRRRSFQWPQKDVDDPVGGKNVGLGDEAVVDVA